MKKVSVLLTIIFMALVGISPAFADSMKENESLTLTQLVDNMASYEKKNISLVGTMLGACMSGCKMWIADGAYKEGDPVALVWAKDNAFKFKTDASGQKVKLQGFAVATYVDLCAIKEPEKTAPKKAEEVPSQDKKDCDPPVKVEGKQLKSITFYATSVEYLHE